MEVSMRVMLNFMALLREVIKSREGRVASWSEVRPYQCSMGEHWHSSASLFFSGFLCPPWTICVSLRGRMWDWDLHMISESMEARSRM